MVFTYKNEAELSAMTPEQRDAYGTEKRQFEAETRQKETEAAIEKALAGAVSSKEVAEIRESLNQIKETSTLGASKEVSVSKQIAAKKDILKALASRTNISEKEVEITTKALSNRASIGNNEQAFDLPDIGKLATRKLVMYDIFPKLTIASSNNNGTIRYYDWDQATTVRAAAMVAEGTAFPESTAKFQKYSIPLQKVGDTLPVTEEFFEDEQMFAAELGLFLETNVALKIDDQLANGDGTGNNLKGVFASVPAFTAPQAGIQDASIYDLIVKVKESITATGGAKYTPDVAFMNIVDINKMKLKKDTYNNYIIPPFATVGGQVVDSILVIESNNVTANTFVLGDRRFARIYEKGGFELSQGMVGTQFTEDEMTLKVRKRLAFLIRNVDATGWKKVTSISAALVTLASTPA